RRDGQLTHVEPQGFDVLTYLLNHRDRVVTKTELLEAGWGDRFVSESALTSRVKAARPAVRGDGGGAQMIRPRPGRGYRVVAEVNETEEGAPQRAHPRLNQEIRFCVSSDGVRIAYASMGSGPPLLKAANWMTRLDEDVESSVWQHWLEGLSRDHRLVRYDER